MIKNYIQEHSAILKTSLLLIIIAVFLTGCGVKKNSYIFIVDLTQSVSAEAKTKAFETIKNQARKLKRGDSITVIPLTGDAAIEASGKAIRLKVSEKREAFDADLKKFINEIAQRLDEMQNSGKTYQQTDLFGTLRIAQDEITVTEKENRRVFLVVLSDMVNSSKEILFEKDAIFQRTETAKKYAEKLMQNKNSEWRGINIYLGLMESTDLRQMPNERREAVREFWQEYFRLGGVDSYQFATDGTGQLSKFIDFKNKS